MSRHELKESTNVTVLNAMEFWSTFLCLFHLPYSHTQGLNLKCTISLLKWMVLGPSDLMTW